MRRIHIIGRKNSGKTTLIVELVREISGRGFRIGTIKHTHHRHELDIPGKDSFRHREAGAFVVGILSPTMNAMFLPALPNDTSESKDDRYAAFADAFADCDLVLVEGDSQANAIRIEVWREETQAPPLASEDGAIHAVISDSAVPANVEVWPRRDVAFLANRLLRLAGDLQ